MKNPSRPALLLAVAALPVAAAEQSHLSLSAECEIAVARSAAPERLRAAASVYVLGDGRYVKAIDGDGALTCIVERNHPESLIPQCFDRNGIESVLPAIIDRSLMALRGVPAEEIDETSAAKMEHGEFNALPGPGVSYMMSAYNYVYVPSASRLLTVPPHVMFYAPNVTNDDIGGSFESMVTNMGTPFVFNPGPQGYMLVYTEHPADPDEVAESCRGQISDAPPPFDPLGVNETRTLSASE